MTAAAGPSFTSSPEFAMRTDTCHAIPSARPELPTTEFFLPLLPEVTRTRYARRSHRTRLVRFVRAEGVAVGLCLASLGGLSYAIATVLTGGAL